MNQIGLILTLAMRRTPRFHYVEGAAHAFVDFGLKDPGKDQGSVFLQVQPLIAKKDWIEQPIFLLHQHEEADRVCTPKDLSRLKLWAAIC